MSDVSQWTPRRVIWTVMWRSPRFALCCARTWLAMKLRLLGAEVPRGLAIELQETWFDSMWVDCWTKKTKPSTLQWIVTVYARQKHQEFIIDAFHAPVEKRISPQPMPATMPVLHEGDSFPLVEL